MTTDQEVMEWFKSIGMKVERMEGNSFFQVKVNPIAGGPSVALVRPRETDLYYIVTIVVDMEQTPTQEVMRSIMMDLMRMNVEFFMTPEKNPRSLHIAKLVFMEGLTRNEMLEAVTLVKNAAYLAITWISGGTDH